MSFVSKPLEYRIMGSLLLIGDRAWHEVVDKISADHWGTDACYACWTILNDIDADGGLIGHDFVAALQIRALEEPCEKFSKAGSLRGLNVWQGLLGNGADVIEMTDGMALSLPYLITSVNELIELSRRRWARKAIVSAYNHVQSPGYDPVEELAELACMCDMEGSAGWVKFSDIVDPGPESVVATWGVSEIGRQSKMDDMVPVVSGRMYVIAGCPGAGKTSFLVQMMASNARNGVPVAFISLEMGTGDVWRFFRAHAMDDADKENIAIMDQDAMDPDSLCGAVRAACRRGCKLVVIDHLQYIECGKQDDNQFHAISRVVRLLTGVIKRENAALLCASQMTREDRKEEKGKAGVKARPPTLGGLRGSADIEQCAALVGLLWRPPDHNEPHAHGEDIVAMRIAKSRFCRPGQVLMRFDGQAKSFTRDILPDSNHRNHAITAGAISDNEDLFR
jgi:KaiC/GvpD/RAD55 family RecA-like ATPase